MKPSTSQEFKVYVSDTVALIWYFANVFEQTSELSRSATSIFDKAINSTTPFIQLIIPAVSIIEIFDKWLKTEEFARKFYFEVYAKLLQSENVYFREVDSDVLAELLRIDGALANHEINDKLILACAMALDCSLISSDPKIKEFVDASKVIPSIIE
jgi:PIN domain nuclease of toxin-antitoxin system